jgi:hypothetical protein
MKLTAREFYERCFDAIEQEDPAVQTARLVELYWSAVDDPAREALFESTCKVCHVDLRKLVIIALKSAIRERGG